MSIVDRIRANGGDVIRDGWTISLRKGRLTDDQVAWIARNKSALMQEVWPEYDAFEERAAIREFCGGQDRAEADAAAYRDVIYA